MYKSIFIAKNHNNKQTTKRNSNNYYFRKDSIILLVYCIHFLRNYDSYISTVDFSIIRSPVLMAAIHVQGRCRSRLFVCEIHERCKCLDLYCLHVCVNCNCTLAYRSFINSISSWLFGARILTSGFELLQN